MLRHENTETSDQVVIDKEGLGLLRWLASSQAQEDLDTGDELIHNLILSPLLVKTSINEVLEKANLDYEHESQQECQDILDSVEGLTDSEISGQENLHSTGYGHSTKIPDNLIPQVDGSGDDQFATYVDNSSQEEVNCDLDKSPQNILQDTCLDLSCTLTSKKRSWGSLTFSTQQMESNDLVSPRFTDTPNDTNNNTETSSLSGNQMNSSSGDSEFKTKIDVGSKEGNTLTGCSMRDLMRRKRCHRIEPSKHGTSKVKKILVRKEQEETTSSPSRVMFISSVNQVEVKMPSALDKPLIADQEIAALESGCCVTNRYANCDVFPMHGGQSFSCGGSNILEAGSIQNVQLGGRESHGNVLHVGVAPESESIMMTDLAILQPEKEEVRQSHNLVKENTAALAGLHGHHEVKEEFGLSSGCSLRSLVKGVPEAFAYMKQPPKFFSEHQTTALTLVQPEDAVSLHVKKEETLSVAASWSLGAGNMERGPIEHAEMTFSRRPPLIDCIDRMPENESTGPSLSNQNFFMNAGDSDRTFDCKSKSFDPAGTADDEILPFFVDTSPVEKLQYKPNVSFPFHHEIVLGVPTHYRNDGSSEFLLTPVYAPPSLDCVTRWLLDLAPQHNIAGVLKETIDHTIPALSPKPCSVSLVDQLSQDSLKKKASICQTEVSKLCNEGTGRNEIEQIGSWQDVSQISGPDAQSKLTPLSQMGFRDPASVGGGQQLTSISMEVLTESRGDLRPDPRFDAVNVIALVIQEDNDEVLDVFVLLRGIDGESCQRNGISGCKVIVASDERQLFDHFVKIVLSIDPDILMGWEIQGSSLGYLAERAAHLGMLLLNDISRISSLETKIPCTKAMQGDLLAEMSLANSIVVEDAIIEDEWGRTHASGVHVGGRIVLNIWRLMRGEVKLNMYTIEAVAEEVLRCKIPSIPFRILTQWFSSGPAKARFRCIEYAVGRTKLNLEIMNQLDMINRTSELARVFGIDFFSVLSRGSQYRVESMLLRLAHTQNYLAVSPGNQQVASQPAMECLPLVMEPESGFYADPVVVLDFQSLYPSMIIAYNLCFSTCLGKVIPPKENILGVSSYSPDPQILMDVKHHVLLTPNGVMYVPSKVRRGVLPRMLEEILSTRIMVKKAMKKLLPSQQVLYRIFNARQLALKLIANVTYGYTAAGFSGRMPCAELADSIVQCGRSTLEKAISLVNSHDKWNARVIYGDTDSMFVLLKGRTRKEAFRIGQEIASEITSMNPDPVTLKMEKVYHPCFLLTKKRYVGYSYESPDQAEPLFDAKGIETVRRDSCGAVAKLLEQSLKLYFEHQDISKVKEYLLRQWTRILGGRVSLQDFVFAKEVRLGTYASGATSLPPAAIVATKAMQADPRAEPRYAERVPYVVIHGAPGARLIDMVIDPMDLLRIDSPFRLNDLYYINKQIIPALQRVFGLVGADLNQWFLEMPRPIRSTVSKCHSYAPNAQRTRIDSYYISRHCILCGEFVQASNHLCNKCFQKGPAATTAVVCRTKKLERDIQHLTAICQHCGGVDWIVENGVKCTSLACTLFYERRKVQKELQALSAVATEVGLYPRCVVEWF